MATKSKQKTKPPKKHKPVELDDELLVPEEVELNPIHLVPASYNPRKMSDDAKKALKVSMKEFSDISGITWNKTTGNIITGHHRWQNLVDAHGIENLKFEEVSKNLYKIKASNDDTGFILRAVEWDMAKEKAANVAANSQHISGEFTADLQSVLEDIQSSDFGSDLYTELSFENLEVSGIDLSDYETESPTHGANNKDQWNSNIGKIEKMDADNREMFDVLSIQIKKGQLEEVKAAVKKAIEGFDAQIR